MSSPAKRRKITTTKDVTPSKPARGLDFFFGKQQPSGVVQANGQTGAERAEPADSEEKSVVLTDEEYARQLQEEWNRQDTAPASSVKEELQPANDEQSEPVETIQDLDADAKEEIFVVNGTTTEQDSTQTTTPSIAPSKNTLSLQSAAAADDTITNTVPFDQSPLTFDPSKYIPQLKSQWASEGGSATYALLTRCFVLINATQSRIKIVDTLVNLLRTLIEADPSSLLPAVWLATNSISPPYIDLELGLGGSAISKALKKVCGLNNGALKTLSDKYGDAGDVAFEAKKRQSITLRKPKPLSIKSVYDSLVRIANSKGTGSVEAKQRIVERLVQDARGAEESRYIVRTLVQHLRIGAVKTTMLIALSRAFLISKPPGASFPNTDVKDLAKLKKDALAEVWLKNEEIIKACFARRPNYNDLIPALLEIGVCDELLLRCGLALHIPLRPMLGNITGDLREMLTKLQGRDFSCEYKYDGQRAQVHCDERGKVTIFSRHLEVMTDKYPDLVALVPKIRGEGVSSFILEGEVVAIDRENGDLKTFQTLSNRARKDVVIGSVKIDVCLFSFDLMYLNGEELLNRSFRERRNLLRSLFKEIPNHFTWVKSFDATSAESDAVLEFFKSATDLKCEGIMVKVLDNGLNPELLKQQLPSAEAEALLDTTTEDTISAVAPPTNLLATSARPKRGKASTTTVAKPAAPFDTTAAIPTRRKPLLSTYEPDKRIDSWLKVKKDYATSADTIDLIPIGAWHGSGRKNAWWSPILLAVRNPTTGALEAVTKCMSGFTDAFYKTNRERYDPDAEDDKKLAWWAASGERRSYVDYIGTPDVWFEPSEVWEVQFADVTLSPTYRAAIGLVSEERGLSLRFPRFLRKREDKGVEEASTDEFLAGLWRKQEERGVREGVGEKRKVDDGDGEEED